MKRYRAADMPPKFRRTAKGRSTRIGESVYLNRFFSAYNLVYLKFFLMWVGCITLDFLIGFRFELLWPVWLLIRHLYESFRVHAFSSSLHYSAFSVFFVCVTATSDLVCYLFIPIQVLIFLASTYVWVQFVYQSSDRGICLPSLFLWALFIVFEYSVRYRFDNATWYLTRTSWITAGLFPSTADSVSIGLSGGSSSSPSSSTRLELYRPFAAHCIGFPVVTLGIRVKSFFSNWRMRVRREEVMRQNEFFERLLADAIPNSFENRKHFISSRSHLAIEQDTLDYDGYTTSDLLSGLDVNGQPRLYSTPNPSFAAICAPPSASLPLQAPSIATTSATAVNAAKKPQQQKLSNKQTLKQNGTVASKKNGLGAIKLTNWRSETNGAGTFAKKGVAEKRSHGMSRDENFVLKVWRVVVRFFFLFVLSTFGQLLSTLTPSVQQWLEGFLAQLRGNPASQDDLISTSGEGSNVADEEEWEHDSNHFHANYADMSASKKKGRRPRGFSSISQVSVSAETGFGLGAPLRSAASHSSVKSGELNGGETGLPTTAETEANNECSLLRENAQKMGEIRQLQKEKQTLEVSVEKLKSELKSARGGEHELRSQLNLAQQQEQNCRDEWKQFEKEQKQKFEQMEGKCRQLGKQNEHFKTNIQALEKRVGELQLKKLEIERELANERLSMAKQHSRDDLTGKSTGENGDQFKLKLTNLDRELKALKREMKLKNDLCTRLEEELRLLRSTSLEENKQVETLRQKNFLLEQTLSSENRLKQDLFRALNDSKAEIASLKVRLNAKQTKEQNDMMNAFRDSNSLFHNAGSGGGSAGSSPTAHQQQQFPLAQQKSLTPPPLSVASSTYNLEQLLQATQNMSYSLGPLDSNGGGSEVNSFAGSLPMNNANSTSPYIGNSASEMLAVGGHRTVNSAAGKGGNC